jgi:Uma2 family endonuclease
MVTGSLAGGASPMTVEAFLRWDGGGHVGKLELVDGHVHAMAPASAVHAIIQGNITTAIKNHLKATGSPCKAAPEAPVIPPLARRINARVPDVTVTCKPLTEFATFDDPVLIVEVMSPSNEEQTWDSIRAIAVFASLQEIVVAQSTEARVDVYRRDSAGNWLRDPETTSATGTVRLTSLGAELGMNEIYDGTNLAPET